MGNEKLEEKAASNIFADILISRIVDVADIQKETLELMLKIQEKNNSTVKFCFFGMVLAWLLAIFLSIGYFVLYEFEYEVVEEEIVETFESNQDSGDNGTNEVHNINIGGTQWQNNQ